MFLQFYNEILALLQEAKGNSKARWLVSIIFAKGNLFWTENLGLQWAKLSRDALILFFSKSSVSTIWAKKFD